MDGESKPVIYVFHGDDEFGINESLKALKSGLGDRAAVEMNYATFDGRSLSINEFEAVSKAVPFLARRRLVVVTNPLAYTQSEAKRSEFLTILDTVPDENAVVLIEYRPLTSLKEKNKGKVHWLEEWGRKKGERFFIREFTVPRGSRMIPWIMTHAEKAGGKFAPRAAAVLGELIADDPRLAEQEIDKLLNYVNFERPVEERDVLNLTVSLPEGDIFEFVDALGNRNRETAIKVFHRLLSVQEPQRIFAMVVRQFRMLLLAKDIMGKNGDVKDVVLGLAAVPFKLHPYPAEKIAHQSRQFSQSQLDALYHRLLEIDSQMKTGKMDVDLSVDLMIAEIS